MSASEHARALVQRAADAAWEKLASDVVAVDVSEQLVITEAFLIASAANERQVRAVVDNIQEKLRDMGAKPSRREGEREGRWVLLDYVDIVIHIQHAKEREHYGLERLWKDCPVLELQEEKPA